MAPRGIRRQSVPVHNPEPVKRPPDHKLPVDKTKHGHKPIGPARKRPLGAQHPTPGPGGYSGKPGHKGKKKPSELDRFLWAEGEQESGNNYAAVNAGSGALGRWQVMPSNLPGWLTESGEPQMTPDQFLKNHKAQNAVAFKILGGYYRQYGPAGAAAMWYSGQSNPDATYGDPPVYQYVDDVLNLMNSSDAGTVTSTGIAVPLPWQLPAVSKTDSWSQQVILTADQFDNAAKALHTHAARIRIERIKVRG